MAGRAASDAARCKATVVRVTAANELMQEELCPCKREKLHEHVLGKYKENERNRPNREAESTIGEMKQLQKKRARDCGSWQDEKGAAPQ